RLVHLWQVQDNAEHRKFPFAWQTLRELQSSGLFASVAGYQVAAVAWTGRPDPEELPALNVSSNFLDVLGVRPALGRGFLPGEDEAGGPRAVVLTDAFWRTRLGADPHVLGTTLDLAGEPTTVVGVLPPGFPFAPGGEARLLLAVQPKGDRASSRIMNWIRPVARLRDGTTVAQARKQLAAFEDALRERFPDAIGGVVTDVVALRDELVGHVEPVLVLLFVCVNLVLLVACVNVANLLLARAAGRQKELAVRLALGAGRARLIRQLLTESALLAAAGGALGLLAAKLSLPLLLAGIPSRDRAGMPFLDQLDVDDRVLAYGAAVVVLTTLLFGLLPALRSSHLDVQAGLKDSAPASAGPLRHRVRDVLVAVEIALAVVLLGSAGLMGKSLLHVVATDPGYRPEGALGVDLSVADPGAAQAPDAIVALRARLQEAVDAIPGVTGTARVSRMPGTGNAFSNSFVRPDRPRPTGPEPEAYVRDVSPGYFRALGIAVLGGRDVGPEDTRSSARVVVINRALQQRYFPDEDAIGKTIRLVSSDAPLTIVGVVGDQTLGGLDEPRPPILYYPDTQSVSARWTLLVRSSRPGIAEELRRALREAAPGLVIGPARTLDGVLQQAPSMFLRRYPVFLLGVFAAVALVLACVGIFGVVSFGVVQRTREFGVRMAVGAARADIVRLVLRGSSAPVLAGALAGLAGSIALGSVFRRLLFGVGSSDPLVLGGVVVVLGAVAVGSALLPALRASRVDPGVALRSL
ncbi:MAG TPA: ABC transporter permease, partial [Myxococcaceae bacterium]|nr:ABC transporter permease [Myxococcaceae bacterium]